MSGKYLSKKELSEKLKNSRKCIVESRALDDIFERIEENYNEGNDEFEYGSERDDLTSVEIDYIESKGYNVSFDRSLLNYVISGICEGGNEDE